MPRVRQPWIPCHPADELATLMALNCDETCLLVKLRWFSFVNFGIEDDEITLKRLAKSFHLSAYKFKKVWPRIEKFFTKLNGRIYYPDDERERLRSTEMRDKRSVSGGLGANARWGNGEVQEIRAQNLDLSGDGTCHPDEVAFATGEKWPPQPHHNSEAVDNAEGHPHPPGQAAADAPTPGSDAGNGADPVVQRAIDLGLPKPSAQLAREVREKFPDLAPAELAARLPRFPGQNSPALWRTMSRVDLEDETRRQSSDSGRKPSAKDEQAQRVMARAIERDKKAGLA